MIDHPALRLIYCLFKYSPVTTALLTSAQVVVDAALACAADFGCQSTCNMLWSLATGGSRPRAALLDALASRLHALMDGASAQQMGATNRPAQCLANGSSEVEPASRQTHHAQSSWLTQRDARIDPSMLHCFHLAIF